MSKKTAGILGIVLVIFLGGFFTVAYFVKQKINPEEIRKLLKNGIEEQFVDARVDINDVEFEVGKKVYFKILKLDIYSTKQKKYLAKLNNVEVKIPLLAILTGGGAINVLVSDPQVNLFQYKDGSNSWVKSLKQGDAKVSKKEATKASSSGETNIEVPDFVRKSSVDFRMKGLKFQQKVQGGDAKDIRVDRIMFKNIGFDKISAYEVLSSFSLKSDGNEMTGKVKLIGEFSLKELLENKALGLSSRLEVTEIKTPFIGKELSLDTKLDLKLSTNGDISFTTNSNIDKFASASLEGTFSKNIVKMNKLSLNLEVEKAASLVALPDIKIENGKVGIDGKFQFNIAKNRFSPDFRITTKEAINIKHPMLNFKSTLSGKYKGTSFDFEAKNSMFEGEFTTKIHTKLDPLNIPSDMAKFSPVFILLKGRNLNIDEKFVKAQLYSKKDKTQEGSEGAEAPTQQETDNRFEVPEVKLTLDINKSLFAKKKLESSGVISLSTNKVIGKDIVMALAKSKSIVNFNSQFYKKDINAKFDVKTKELNLKDFNNILPSFLEGVEGVINSEAKGSAKVGAAMTYSVDAKISAKNGLLKGLNLKELTGDLLGKLGKLAPKKSSFTDRFDSLQLSSNLNHKNIRIQNFDMIGNKGSGRLKLNGLVSMLDKQSDLKGTLYVKKMAADLKKKTGQTDIPIYLTGKGFVLKPDVKYTTSKLLKSASKKEVKKAKDKLKESLKKKAKKLFKGFKL